VDSTEALHKVDESESRMASPIIQRLDARQDVLRDSNSNEFSESCPTHNQTPDKSVASKNRNFQGL
jgi:hypothetical protein